MPSERGREVDIEKAALDEDEDRRLAIGSEPGSSKSSDAGVDLDAKESGAVQTSNGPVGELTWPDGGLEAWGNILGCTLISLTAFGESCLSEFWGVLMLLVYMRFCLIRAARRFCFFESRTSRWF